MNPYDPQPPRDPFEVMGEARDRALGWAVVGFLGWLIASVLLAMGNSLAVVLVAAAIGSVTIPALVLAARELVRRSRAKRATTYGGVR